MRLELLFSLLVLFLTGMATTFLALFAWERRNKTPEAPVFTALLAACTLYSFGYAGELSALTMEGKFLWSRVQYLGIAPLPALWLLLSIRATDRTQLLTPLLRKALVLLPLITLTLHASSPWHNLYYRNLSLVHSGPFLLLHFQRGLWYYVHLGMLQLSFLAGNILFFLSWKNSSLSGRRESAVLLTASLFPWITHILYIIGLNPWGVDTNPFVLTVTTIVCGWGFFRHKLLNLMPFARERILEVMSEGVIVVDKKNRIIDFNSSAGSMIPPLVPRSLGMKVEEVFASIPELLEALRLEEPLGHELSLPDHRGERSFRCRISHIRDRGGSLLAKAVFISDVSEQNNLRKNLEKVIAFDELTGLYTHRHFWETCRRELLRCRRRGNPFAILLISLNLFQEVKLRYGHEAEDLVLKEIAALCTKTVRAYDILGRYGDEEFALLLPETDLQGALSVVERLSREISQAKIPFRSSHLKVTASFGIVPSNPGADDDLESLLLRAERAVLQAKEEDLGKVVSLLPTGTAEPVV